MLEGTKPASDSLTIRSAVAGLLMTLALLFGDQLHIQVTQTDSFELATLLINTCAFIVAWVGRVRATQRIE